MAIPKDCCDERLETETPKCTSSRDKGEAASSGGSNRKLKKGTDLEKTPHQWWDLNLIGESVSRHIAHLSH